MPREKEAYRDNLELLDRMFPDKNILTVSDVAKFSGCCYRVAKKIYPFKDNRISKATLARFIS